MRIGRYEVISHLATGGMAQIFLARTTGLGQFERHVVLKTILRERATDQRFVTMFLDEAKLAATLNHQNVAQVYEVDEADGNYYMAMEYVHGENARAILETTIRRGWTIPLELAVMVISGAAAGLHHAHERRGKNGQPLNIVHRDVSPANIMVGYDGSIKVLDFGIAKAEERATKTVGGTIKGKYGYMSPEQCKGKPIDRRSDIFALGICLYEMTTLRRAFKGNDDFETMKRIVANDVVLPSIAVPGYPRELEAIALTAMANDPNARFQTAQELIEALDAFAVRAKLTGSNTAMGRFMGQLFGQKKEPWVDGAGDRATTLNEEVDNEKTAVVDQKNDTVPTPEPFADAQTPPVRRKSSQQPLVPMDFAPAGGQADAAAWQADNSTHLKRQSARLAAVRNTPPLERVNPPERKSAPQMSAPAPRRSSQQPAHAMVGPETGPTIARPLDTAPTIARPIDIHSAPTIARPLDGRMPSPPSLDDISEPGAKPLVDDMKLGWDTKVNRSMAGDGAGTRLGTQAHEDYTIRSNRGWMILAAVVILAAAAAVTIMAWESADAPKPAPTLPAKS